MKVHFHSELSDEFETACAAEAAALSMVMLSSDVSLYVAVIVKLKLGAGVGYRRADVKLLMLDAVGLGESDELGVGSGVEVIDGCS